MKCYNDMLEYLSSSESGNFFLFAGPCVIEGEEMAMEIAGVLKEVTRKFDIPLVFKGSFRKANRSRLDSFTGIGDHEALRILAKVGREFELPVVTDIHEAHEARLASEYVDVLQIPAFLCRQTELLVAAAKTGKLVNIKKGQFLSPGSMANAVEKIRTSGNNQVTVTERGTTFGYQDLIVDMRGIPAMQRACACPVIMDVTHSLQQPNQASGVTGGVPEMISTISSCAIAAGADGLFMETHMNPAMAKSDGANMLKLDKMESLLEELTILRKAVNNIKTLRETRKV